MLLNLALCRLARVRGHLDGVNLFVDLIPDQHLFTLGNVFGARLGVEHVVAPSALSHDVANFASFAWTYRLARGRRRLTYFD